MIIKARINDKGLRKIDIPLMRAYAKWMTADLYDKIPLLKSINEKSHGKKRADS